MPMPLLQEQTNLAKHAELNKFLPQLNALVTASGGITADDRYKTACFAGKLSELLCPSDNLAYPGTYHNGSHISNPATTNIVPAESGDPYFTLTNFMFFNIEEQPRPAGGMSVSDTIAPTRRKAL
ncbi:MAG: hypothetical protein LBT46_03945 [Planctomycetaceae bacterium]|jgi:hypothetical protein|nr:hypothetical protein [Planctomycetaceae bacterium]